MAFPPDMTSAQQQRLAALGFLVIAVVAAVAAVFAVLVLDGGSARVEAQTIREYNIEIVQTDIDYGDGNIWHAWTYKLDGEEAGSVPGPTLDVTLGEKLVVNVTNNLDIVHSFHTHFSNYDLSSDGSQLNTITGEGAGAMIPPGETWTYEFVPDSEGIFYYHCHSADGDRHITEHIHQGLYGAIIVHAVDEPKAVRNEVLFMSEIGFETEGENIPVYIMNGMGLPGGEHALEEIYAAEGIEAVAAQFNKTMPVFEAETGEEVRLHVINIGDAIHSWHGHNVDHISLGVLGGNRWPANLLPLVPGAADTLSLTFTKPGLWLFHCHVVGHADAGMIGLFNITEPSAEEPPGEE